MFSHVDQRLVRLHAVAPSLTDNFDGFTTVEYRFNSKCVKYYYYPNSTIFTWRGWDPFSKKRVLHRKQVHELLISQQTRLSKKRYGYFRNQIF